MIEHNEHCSDMLFVFHWPQISSSLFQTQVSVELKPLSQLSSSYGSEPDSLKFNIETTFG